MLAARKNGPMKHRLPIKVRFGELDPYNHVNHSVYVAWFEAGRCEALEACGLGLAELATSGYQFVVSTLQVTYKISARASDLLVVETFISDLGGATSLWSQRLVRDVEVEAQNEVLSSAEVRAAFCNTQGRPTRIPPEIRTQLASLVGE